MVRICEMHIYFRIPIVEKENQIYNIYNDINARFHVRRKEKWGES